MEQAYRRWDADRTADGLKQAEWRLRCGEPELHTSTQFRDVPIQEKGK